MTGTVIFQFYVLRGRRIKGLRRRPFMNCRLGKTHVLFYQITKTVRSFIDIVGRKSLVFIGLTAGERVAVSSFPNGLPRENRCLSERSSASPPNGGFQRKPPLVGVIHKRATTRPLVRRPRRTLFLKTAVRRFSSFPDRRSAPKVGSIFTFVY